MSDLALMYLLGLFTGGAMGSIATFLVLKPNDGWTDVQKGKTTRKLMENAGIGVKPKKD